MTSSQAVWLYGSYARGDAESDSDLDLLVIGEGDALGACQLSDPKQLANASVSRYSWREIQGMAEYGSLFLHHVRLEGRPVLEDGSCQGILRRLLDGLPRYAKAGRDIRGFATVLGDIGRAVGAGNDDPFELSVLGTVVRHSSILGCWMHGVPTFGRTEPVEVIAKIIGCEEEWEEFDKLYQYRLYCDRRVGKETLGVVDGGTWWARAQTIVNHLEEIRNNDCSKVPT